mmetsp:Transcript_29996/g.70587  ORF Transcript_29996/g.70587 Transcript_29996/m.70587 type:complete len:193 (+) Transcript_29996:89-667(+)
MQLPEEEARRWRPDIESILPPSPHACSLLLLPRLATSLLAKPLQPLTTDKKFDDLFSDVCPKCEQFRKRLTRDSQTSAAMKKELMNVSEEEDREELRMQHVELKRALANLTGEFEKHKKAEHPPVNVNAELVERVQSAVDAIPREEFTDADDCDGLSHHRPVFFRRESSAGNKPLNAKHYPHLKETVVTGYL